MKKMTYISLFSSGGVGCYGFLDAGFHCISTVEIIKRRLNIQIINDKCKYKTGYINDDICLPETKNKIKKEINFWIEKENIKKLDVLIATPPCQGMSTANSKKNEKDIIRNSLVVESIKLTNDFQPNFFIFENVPAFMKTTCIVDDKKYKIGEYIYEYLSNDYSIYHDVINFKDYGVPSSRSRCLVIGVHKTLANYISPLELFPDFIKDKTTLKDSIYHLPRLKTMGEIDENDIYHFFRSYETRMREWISNLKPGMSAYENHDINKRPHRIINNQIVFNKNKMGGKYKRQEWNNVASCIHTRNDQLASQNTIHPEDDRVFSIRELMILMTIPNSFKWSNESFNNLNAMSFLEKRKFLKENEINIRQIIGEAVPTKIFNCIAKKIKSLLNKIDDKLKIENLELKNPNREINEAFYTNKFLVSEIIKYLPNFTDKDEITILEPSVGLGSFVFQLFKKYEKIKKVFLDVIDVDPKTIEQLKKILRNNIPKNFKINFIVGDFLLYNFENKKYDLVIGNPPFKTITKKDYPINLFNKFGIHKNIIVYFILITQKISSYFSFVLPKNFLIAPQYNEIRNYLAKLNINNIFDFGNKGFDDVTIETIALSINNKIVENHNIKITNIDNGKEYIVEKNYIIDSKFPNWIIYRNHEFDEIANSMNFNVFNFYRDRQITNKYLTLKKGGNSIPVLRSRNLSIDRKIIKIKNYDKYLIENTKTNNFKCSEYLNMQDIYICPNFTNNIRVIKKPKNTLVNGSLAIFIPKKGIYIKQEDLLFFSSDKFKKFYNISNNFQKNTINIDKNSIFYFGIREK